MIMKMIVRMMKKLAKSYMQAMEETQAWRFTGNTFITNE